MARSLTGSHQHPSVDRRELLPVQGGPVDHPRVRSGCDDEGCCAASAREDHEHVEACKAERKPRRGVGGRPGCRDRMRYCTTSLRHDLTFEHSRTRYPRKCPILPRTAKMGPAMTARSCPGSAAFAVECFGVAGLPSGSSMRLPPRLVRLKWSSGDIESLSQRPRSTEQSSRWWQGAPSLWRSRRMGDFALGGDCPVQGQSCHQTPRAGSSLRQAVSMSWDCG